ncbi:MAG TPA: hypothetical protein VIV27_00685 [Halioglobus sp.]
MSLWLARFALVAALVLSQTLYAGHGVVHNNGDKVDCQICLQASTGSAVLAGTEVQPLIAIDTTIRDSGTTVPAAASTLPNSHPTRAPPLYSF